jgi:hypothetical protein
MITSGNPDREGRSQLVRALIDALQLWESQHSTGGVGAPPIPSGDRSFRYARLVDPMARAPGHHLCTVYFKVSDRSFLLQMIEGRTRDVIVFRGVSRKGSPGSPSSSSTTVVLFKLSGPGIDEAREFARAIGSEFPSILYRNIVLQPDEAPDEAPPIRPTPDRTLHIIPLPITSIDGVSPDSLLLHLLGEQSEVSEIVITGFSEGLPILAAVALGGIGIMIGAAHVAAIQMWWKGTIKWNISASVPKGGELMATLNLAWSK